MARDSKRLPTPSNARRPAGGAIPSLRKQEIPRNESLRGPVIMGGAGAVPSVWED
ncbi:MAG: hypothetical protein ABSG55_01875 [Dehalococcoidia bacterium]